MIDNIFIKDKNDYIKYSELKPRYKYSRKKVKFICTKCNCISEKTFVCLTFPFICTNCIKNSEETKEKRKQTNLKKFGTEFASQSNICKEHLKETCIKKYGTINPFQIDEVKDKIKETNKKRYGAENPFQSEEIKEKIKHTIQDRYGTEYITQTEFFKEKSKQTCIEKYGTENAILNYDIFVKSRQKYYYDERYFDSSWELAYYIWLKDNNIDFEYQPDIKFKYIYNNEIHYYHPDFKIDNKLQEIKGNLFFENNNINEKMICPFNRQLDDLYESKHQCMIANNVQILTKDNIKEYIIYVKLNYGINFLKNCKVQKNYKKG